MFFRLLLLVVGIIYSYSVLGRDFRRLDSFDGG